jgi:hypothetical protein
LRVQARIGNSTWMTSIFPGKAGYVLPVTVTLIDFA